jgi:hypothetical protein
MSGCLGCDSEKFFAEKAIDDICDFDNLNYGHSGKICY